MKTLKLTESEESKLIKILQERYSKSLNLFEISTIKGILEKLGIKVDDWTPDFEDL